MNKLEVKFEIHFLNNIESLILVSFQSINIVLKQEGCLFLVCLLHFLQSHKYTFIFSDMCMCHISNIIYESNYAHRR